MRKCIQISCRGREIQGKQRKLNDELVMKYEEQDVIMKAKQQATRDYLPTREMLAHKCCALHMHLNAMLEWTQTRE